MSPVGTTIAMSTQRGGAAARDGQQHFSMLQAHPPATVFKKRLPRTANDIGYLQRRPAHELCICSPCSVNVSASSGLAVALGRINIACLHRARLAGLKYDRIIATGSPNTAGRLVCYEMQPLFCTCSLQCTVASITAINCYSGSGFQYRLEASPCRRLGKAVGNKNNIIWLQLQISAFSCKN